MKVLYIAIAALLLLVIVFGCSSNRNSPRILSENFTDNPGYQNKAAYLIKPGDMLRISNLNWFSSLFPDPVKTQHSQSSESGYHASVNQDGTIKLPEIGLLRVAGLTRLKLADSLSFRYRDIIRDPIFEVEITNLRVKVLGACNIQGVVVLDKETQSLGEVLAKAGGIKFNEAGEKIQIIRGDGQEQKIIEYDFQQLGEPRIMNLVVYNNDIIYIPPSREGIRSVKLSRKLILIQPILIALNLAILVINLTK
ncbi:polysaccharide export outer membrane protein [Dyadobacter koreensis]|uniref:Polysaccharide export outer membrane protein n=1 Tax=Dyadobacter koreensis TaxID=408657 RepID=A0A1H6WQM3_9BACT|nr:polysaccharide biosynthesis/export family protein [Dyadobacter koreensis]SEJ18096.1 polysaccharide export outer membrane protein [Dyadobacter koreensis]